MLVPCYVKEHDPDDPKLMKVTPIEVWDDYTFWTSNAKEIPYEIEPIEITYPKGSVYE